MVSPSGTAKDGSANVGKLQGNSAETAERNCRRVKKCCKGEALKSRCSGRMEVLKKQMGKSNSLLAPQSMEPSFSASSWQKLLERLQAMCKHRFQKSQLQLQK